MKLIKPKSIKALAALIAMGLIGCGGDNPPPVVNQPVIGGAVTGTCIPINTRITFVGNNVSFSTFRLTGGRLPLGQFSVDPYGTQQPTSLSPILVGGGSAGGPYQRTGVDGTISMAITPQFTTTVDPLTGGFGFPQSNQGVPASVTGYITISSLTQSDILYQFGGLNGNQTGYNNPYNSYNPYYPNPGTLPQPALPNVQSVCVSEIAIDAPLSGTTIVGGNIYLYINNTQHGYILYF